MQERAAPRRLWLAAMLGVLMPGLGHIYCGRVREGLGTWGVVLAAWVICLLVWTRWLFAPFLPALVLALAWVALQLVLVADLVRHLRTHPGPHALGPLNHGVAYLSIFLGLWVLPVAASVGLVVQARVGSIEVRSEGMFPHLLPGDQVLFDRAAFAERPPVPGDLVVVEGPAGQCEVARVAAGPGQEVHLRDGRLVVDGEPLPQGQVEALEVRRFGQEEAAQLARLEGFVESNRGRHYVVTYDRDRDPGPTPAPERLGSEEIYVLGDNRDASLSARGHGRIRRSAVLGRPRCIWASRDAEGASRPGRIGLDLR